MFATRSAVAWQALLEGDETCVDGRARSVRCPPTPPHGSARAFIQLGGVLQPGPAPRFSRRRPLRHRRKLTRPPRSRGGG